MPLASADVSSARRRASLLLLRLSGWPRRVTALALFALAALLALHHDPAGSAAPEPARAKVLIARHELPAGSVVRDSDLRSQRVDTADVPHGALRSPPIGRSVAVPIHQGEIVTDVRFVGPSLARAIGGAGAVAVPVRLADADAARLLRPGDHVDVFAGGTDDTSATTLARDAVVVLVPKPDPDVGLDGALVLLATNSDTARHLATSAASSRITATLRPDQQ
ncbi:MAG TPA: SAF domain-containing protein [Mycobacteriales bacterium]|nr:SAF domain-containing protein [Mycobacteriales bacterium]